MPLSDDSIVQENSGTFAATTSDTGFVVTLPSGTTAGTTAILVTCGPNIGAGLPTGWTRDHSDSPNVYTILFRKVVGAGETSWTFPFTTTGVTQGVTWYVAEVAGLDPDVPLDVSAASHGGPPGRSVTGPITTTEGTGTTPTGIGMDSLVISAWAAVSPASTIPGTWGSYVSGAQAAQVGLTGGAGYGGLRLAVARRLSGGASAGPFTDTATYTEAASTLDEIYGVIYSLRAVDSPIGFPVKWLAGFEQGSHNGIGSAAAIGKPLWTTVTGTAGTDVIVQSSSARPGGSGYGCRIVQSAAAKSLIAAGASGGVLGGPYLTGVLGFGVNVVSSTGLVVLAALESSTPSVIPMVQLVYDTATTKLGVRVGTTGTPGTPAYQSGTTAAGTWVWVDLRALLVGPLTPVAHADWSLDGVAQTSPADVTSTRSSNWWAVRFGSTTTQTVTLDVDDVVFAPQSPAYPLGAHVIRALTVDPAGTPTVNGTVGNFALVTSNVTGAALTTGTLTSARDNIDELPPTISASSDGVVQTTTAATDYLEFPMATLTLSTEVVAAVRLVACTISTTGAGAGSLSFKGNDGATVTDLVTSTGGVYTPGSSTTVSATVPPYTSAMWPNTWTAAKLNAAALRVGYSDDATPDMGIHAMYLEVATRPAATGRQVSVEDDLFTADVVMSPYSSASQSYVVTSNHPTRGVTFDYSLAGVPQTPVTVSAASSTTVTVDVTDYGGVSGVTLTPDPDPA